MYDNELQMGATVSLILKQLEVEYKKPVGMGIIGPGATIEQAESRISYAGNATRAAIRMARHLGLAGKKAAPLYSDEDEVSKEGQVKDALDMYCDQPGNENQLECKVFDD